MRDGYLQVELSTGRPEMLVSRLLERAVHSIRTAIAAGTSGDVVPRTRAIAKAVDIVTELRAALDLERGQEVAQNLDALYEYVNHRLLAATIEPEANTLEEALRPLEIIAEGWAELCRTASAEARP